ncbi:PD40 domain-containing protein [Dolichospermum planctonicum UHCC 0167]|uniref:WD40 domain-containing protein n=1 Tax=Dolichospermum planctonicum TaxID=136072 RepID=UPI00144323BF|nr:PD40 domain-containing protein [Dolichospermum planctonicum]MCW9681038.1 PD40 domain-containing protein [Dolichospermum planctonicum UHCC 0167]
MVKKQQADDIIAANKQSLRSLDRAITFSKNQFSVILLCCNYKFLHELIQQQLVEIGWGSDKLQTITLDKKTTSLYTTIQSQLSLTQPAGLMITGFELVDDIDDLLRSINQVRDEFRKCYQMPMVFWINDQILAKIWQLAPDFASWAATPIRFDMNSQGLLELLQQETENLFTEILQGDYTQSNHLRLEKIWTNKNQLHYAIFELKNWGIEIEPELNSSLDFIFGIDDYINNRIYSALNNFQKSLHFWDQQEYLFPERENTEKCINSCGECYSNKNNSALDYKYPLKKAILLLYIGLCFYRLAKQNKIESKCNLQSAKTNILQSFQILELTGCKKLVSEFIRQLAEILYILEEWTELEIVAEKSLELHRIYDQKIQLACDYNILAHIALHNSNSMQASILAYTSLIYLEKARKNEELNHYLLPLLLEQIYMLTLAQALNNLGKITVAKEYIDQASYKLLLALESSEYEYDIYRYINLLDILKSLYFQAGRYLQSHIIKQKLNSLDQQYGFVPFIGAGCLKPLKRVTNPGLISKLGNSNIALEITASGREDDVNNLIGRISRADQKLIIIHGQSGVGKSSLVNAGLVPALQNRSVGDQIAVPVVVQLYTNWLKELEKSLTKAMLKMANKSAIEIESIESSADIQADMNVDIIYQQLRKNADNHLITVLIFDQLEEFFFGDTDGHQKQEFDKFISDCLSISFVKVILTLREDYLHRLLDFKYVSSIETIKNNILDKKFRYQLNNFSAENARQLLENLTERSHKLHQQSQLKLEPALIDALLADLSSEIGEIRPIELQLVGAQLQDKCITTLTQYQPYRPKQLIQEYIQELIKECGQENERSALLVLYLLTDENHKRPFKTYAELKAELSELEDTGNLDLILSILVNSGLVVIFHNCPKQYQLIHDYLVDLIRHLEQQESGLQTQINQLRDKVKNSYQEIERLRSELSKTEEKVILVETQNQQGDNLLTEIRELRQREEETQIKIERLRTELREKELIEKLVESQKKQHLNAIRLNRALKIALTTSIIAIFSLASSVITARNSEIQTLSASSETLFAGHKGINSLKESLKAGQKLEKTLWVDASTREKALTAMYQAIYGVKERNRLEGHISAVKMVTFSNDKSLIASAGADTTINLWSPCGLLLKTLSGHESVVNSVNFSPDSQMLVSAGQDKTIKLWNRNGELLKTLLGHSSVVNSASFSPDGQIIASASTDQTIKLWSRDGKLITTLLGHKDAVLAVAWSSDGKILASSSSDKTIKLWNRDGKLIKTLPAQEDAVVAIAWSGDGKILASGSLDKKIKLWNREGKLLKTLAGHSGGVIAVNFSRDGHTLASASMDETIKLWHLNGNLLGTLRGHNNWVNSVSFSPDGRSLASGGKDKTIILWRWDSLILRNPQENNDWVTSISFSPDSSIVAGASRDKTIKLWNRDGKLLKTLVGHDDQIWGVDWSGDGKILASGSKDKTIKLWNRDGKLLKTLLGHDDVVLAVAWSSDGKILASGSKDKTIKLWNRDGKLLKTLVGHTHAINWVSFSPNGKLLASASDDKLVKVWTSEGEIIKNLTGHTRGVNGVAWSPNGDVLASVSLDGMVNIWGENGKLIKTLRGSGDGFIGVSFSPDGKTLAVNSDRQVKLWNRQGVLLMSLKGSDEELTGVSFSPDGKMLAAGSSGGRIILRKLSDITLESLLRSNCDILNDYLLYNPNMTRGDADGDQSYHNWCENN